MISVLVTFDDSFHRSGLLFYSPKIFSILLKICSIGLVNLGGVTRTGCADSSSAWMERGIELVCMYVILANWLVHLTEKYIHKLTLFH